MTWSQIMAPLAGGGADAEALTAAAALAAPFEAELSACYAPADAADLMPWMGEGFMGGVQVAALDSLKDAAHEGELHARAHFDAVAYARKVFTPLASPVGHTLCVESRLSDVTVFGRESAHGRGPLVEAFQQVLMEERRPIFVARGPVSIASTVAVAWDGGREATRAARIAIPWLQRAGRVVILTAPQATPRDFDPARLKEHFASRGVTAEVEVLPQAGDAGPLLLSAVRAAGAAMLVAGAFGHRRFQQFIFGGTTRRLLDADDGPGLFITSA